MVLPKTVDGVGDDSAQAKAVIFRKLLERRCKARGKAAHQRESVAATLPSDAIQLVVVPSAKGLIYDASAAVGILLVLNRELRQ